MFGKVSDRRREGPTTNVRPSSSVVRLSSPFTDSSP
jgi:hypothetical protein